jgi:hypothetical protein
MEARDHTMTTRLSALSLTLVLFAPALAAAQPPPPAQPEPAPEPTPAPAPEPEPTPAPEPAATTSAPAASAEPAATAESGPLGTAFGVGIHGMLTGPFGPAIVYNMTRFHIEGLLAFESNGATELTVGGRFWFHVHQTSASTLSLGGGLAFSSLETEPIPPETRGEDQTVIHLEGGAQIRFFPVSNVAISASVGLGVLSGDADLFALTGQLTGGAGLTYFF